MHCVQNRVHKRVQNCLARIVAPAAAPSPLPCTGVTVPACFSCLGRANSKIGGNPPSVSAVANCRVLRSRCLVYYGTTPPIRTIGRRRRPVARSATANLVYYGTTPSNSPRWLPASNSRGLTASDTCGQFPTSPPKYSRRSAPARNVRTKQCRPSNIFLAGHGGNWLADSCCTSAARPRLAVSRNEKAMSTETPSEVPHLLTLRQAAQRLTICRRTLERLIAAGQFPRPVKIGRSTRVPESDVLAYLAKIIGLRGAS
ncbi:transcriptional regulator, AlpA family [Opitutus sp. GAS368]|nr:transcriptional regulator, AlpA family [Opitutus sp. GAS368]